MFAWLRSLFSLQPVTLTWLESIRNELECIQPNGYGDPGAEITSRDHVVGIADDELRKLYVLMMRHVLLDFAAKGRYMASAGLERDKLHEEAMRAQAQFEALCTIFWVSCRAAFPELWGKREIGIRKGWQLVWSDPEEKEDALMSLPLEAAFEKARLPLGGDAISSIFRGAPVPPSGDFVAGIREPKPESSEPPIGSDADLEEVRRRFQAADKGEKSSGGEKPPPVKS